MASFQPSIATLLAVLAQSLPLTTAQFSGQVEPNVTICNWANLRTGLIRDTIYMDGGKLWWQSATRSDGSQVIDNDGGVDGIMFTLNLSKSFDTTTFNSSAALLEVLSKTGGSAGNNIAPNFDSGAMFVDNHELILYGGLDAATDAWEPPDADAVTGYEAYRSGSEPSGWSSGFLNKDLPDGVTRYVSNGAAASVPSEELAFYFSGLRGQNWAETNSSTREWYLAETLIEVDMSDMRSEEWSNSSLPEKVSPRADAQLEWIPVNGRGILLAIGGVPAAEDLQSAGLNDSQIADVEDQAPRFTESLSIYDIVSQTWYLQETSGEGPGPLSEACSVMVPAKDYSSFNIYVYGGYDGLNSTVPSSDDVWILSIPAFTWIKAYSGDAVHGRRRHRCEKVYPDQMFVIGGVNPDPSQCVPDGLIRVFNLNTLEFQNVYDPEEWSEYVVPDKVVDVIGGDGDGGATKTASFDSTALASIFDTPYTREIEVYYPYGSDADESTRSGGPPVVRQDGMAKWVAPVLGVVLSLIVLSILAVVLLLWRRRRLIRRNSMTGSVVSSHHNNRIANWMNGVSSTTTPSVSKTHDSVTSNDLGSDPSVASPLVGAKEAASREVCEVEAKTPSAFPPTLPVEMAASSRFSEDSKKPRSTDFAYPTGVSNQSPSGEARDALPSPVEGSASSSPPSRTVSLQSPDASPSPSHATLPHKLANNRQRTASIDSTIRPEAHVRTPGHEPTHPQSRARSPSPPSEPATATPSSPLPPDAGADGEGGGASAGHGTAGGASRGGPISPSSAESLISIREEPQSRDSRGVQAAADPASPQSTESLQRQPTAGKKSSFGELLNERGDDEGK